MPSNLASPSPASPVSMELPEEVDRAIEELVAQASIAGEGVLDAYVPEARSALTAAIFSRLREAESAAEDAWQDKETAIVAVSRQLRDALARVERLQAALKPFADVCDADHMRYVKDEQVLELSTRAEVPVSEKLRGRDFRAARAILAEADSFPIDKT